MKEYLILNLEAPMMSFGSEVTGAFGPTAIFPGISLLTGFLANALGWDRTETERHQALQDRLIMGSMLVREGHPITDYQTAILGQQDKAWTRRGVEGRKKSATSFKTSPDEKRRTGRRIDVVTNQRWRDVRADARCIIAATLSDDGHPNLEQLAQGLIHPERPLFLGRKPFTPSSPLMMGIIEADSVHHALEQMSAELQIDRGCKAQWPETENGSGTRIAVRDMRNWRAGVHGGERQVIEGTIGASG